jgi:hypothetical protein
LPKEILDRAKDILAHIEKPEGAVAHAINKQRSRFTMKTAEKPQWALGEVGRLTSIAMVRRRPE